MDLLRATPMEHNVLTNTWNHNVPNRHPPASLKIVK
jgi:hypothetical protein